MLQLLIIFKLGEPTSLRYRSVCLDSSRCCNTNSLACSICEMKSNKPACVVVNFRIHCRRGPRLHISWSVAYAKSLPGKDAVATYQ